MSNQYNKTLDSLRGVSIMWVVLHHVPVGLPTWLEFIRQRGDLGVELFFAISGILVTKSILSTFKKDQSLGASVKEYFVKRASRIFPAFYLTLLGIFLLSILVPSLNQKIHSISDIVISFPLYVYNYAKFYSDGTVPGALGVFWSLCFEEQFYILLLLFFALFKRQKFNMIFSILIVLSIGTRVYQSLEINQYFYNQLQYYTHYRLDAILLGSLAVLNIEKIKEKVLGMNEFLVYPLALLLWGIYNHNFSSQLSRSLNYIFVSIGFTGVALTAYIDSPKDKLLIILKKIINNKLFVMTGVISYEIYLTHQIFNGVLAKTALKSNAQAYSVALFVISFIGAYLLHRFFSTPMNILIRNKFLKQKFKRHENSNVLISS